MIYDSIYLVFCKYETNLIATN